MTTTPVQSTDPTLAAASAAIDPNSAAAQNATINQSQFLTLFIAQLQNQDPLNPQDPSQMTSQLAEFSSLEQLTQVNTNLNTLNATSKESVTSTLLGLIGKTISYDGSSIDVAKGKAPAVDFSLSQHADKVTATVSDAGGNVIRTIELGSKDPGSYTFQFDGRDANGVVLPDGTYSVQITTSEPGQTTPTPLSLQATATVDGVDLTGSTPSVIAGGRSIGIDSLLQIKD